MGVRRVPGARIANPTTRQVVYAPPETYDVIRERLAKLLFEQPYTRIRTVVENCGVSRPTATGWLSDLVSAGVLRELKIGRERLFVNHGFLEVLLADELEQLDV